MDLKFVYQHPPLQVFPAKQVWCPRNPSLATKHHRLPLSRHQWFELHLPSPQLTWQKIDFQGPPVLRVSVPAP